MWEQVERILRDATGQISDRVASFLPGLVVALLLMLATIVVALVVRALLARTLRGLDFDRWIERLGLWTIIGWSPAGSPSATLARVTFWTILVLGALASLTALNATLPSQLALSVFDYVPHVIAGMSILVVGAIAARLLARSVLIGAVNMQIRSARLLSLTAKWLVLLVAGAMALDHLGIGRSVLLVAFAILFGGIVFAAALAVGLGARDAVRDAIARQLREAARDDDTVNHV